MSSPAAGSTFLLSFHHGIWRVTCNGQFYGDYRSEQGALEGIADAQKKLSPPHKVVRVTRDQH